MASDKTYTKKVNLYFIRTKYGTYPQCDLVTCRQEVSKRAKFKKTLPFWEEKISNVLETLCITNEITERFFYTSTEND